MARPPKYTTSRLAQWLKLTGRTRIGFAAEIGLHHKTISRVANGAYPTIRIAKVIVAGTGGAVPLEHLYSTPLPDMGGRAARPSVPSPAEVRPEGDVQTAKQGNAAST